jgi:hypothetical protein
LSEHDRLVLARAFDFTDSTKKAMAEAAWEYLDATLAQGISALLKDPPTGGRQRDERALRLGKQCADMAVQGVLEVIQAGRLY